MCESHFGVVPISPKKDIRKLQLNGRLFELDIYVLTKKILLYRFFSYQYYPACNNYEFIQNIFLLLSKYNPQNHLLLYLNIGFFSEVGIEYCCKIHSKPVQKPTNFFGLDCAIFLYHI